MQRRVEKADRHRPPGHGLEDACEIVALERQQSRERHAPLAFVGGQDHAPHIVDAVALEEHVLGTTQANALGPEIEGVPGHGRRVGVGAHLDVAKAVRPGHHGLVEAVPVALGGFQVAGKYAADLRRGSRDFAGVDRAGRTVQRNRVPLPQDHVADAERSRGVVDGHFGGPADAHLAQLTGHQGGVRGHATARRQDPFGSQHSLQVVGTGLGAAQDHALAPLGRRIGALGRKGDATRGGTGTCRQATCDLVGAGKRIGVEHRRKQRVDRVGRDLHECAVALEQPLVVHLHGDPHRRQAGALAIAGLQHVELLVLDRELEVLHVAEVAFELRPHIFKLVVYGRHVLGQLVDGLGRADASDDVFALGVDEVLAVQRLLAVGRVAREGDPGGAVGTAVAEHHGLDVDGGAPRPRDAVALPVEDGAVVRPGAEHRADGAPKLLMDVLRERRADVLLNESLVAFDQGQKRVRVEIGVLGGTGLTLGGGEQFLERIGDLVGLGAHLEDDVAVHVDEAAVAIVGEAPVAGEPRQPFNRLVVQAQVEDGVHHSGHGLARPGAYRHQERVGGVAETGALLCLYGGELFANGFMETGRVALLVVVVVSTYFGGDGESRRNRETDAGHLGEVRALAAEQFAHLRIAVGLCAEREHVPRTLLVRHAMLSASSTRLTVT